jgi:hypothetical protein
MPSSSKKQHNFMEAVAHNPAFAKKAGVPQSVGQDFSNADKGRKFSKGGDIMATEKKVKTTKMGAVRTAAPSRDGIVKKAHTKGKQVKMAGSGVPKGVGMKRGGKC